MRLIITATPLTGRWSVTSHTRRDRPAWPPSPDTLFSALVASSASQGNATPKYGCIPHTRATLKWTETASNSVRIELHPAHAGYVEVIK